MAGATYKHTPLASGSTIRVLDLDPSKTIDAPIQCSLRQLSLVGDRSQSTSYEALSYVWGSPIGDQPISCEGGTLLVTLNCVSALRHFRLKSRSRTLWIDSLCIDQSSTDEKNQQVKLMGSVYKLATRVLIWLGAGSPATSRKFRKFKSLALYLRGRASLSATLTAPKQHHKRRPNVRKALDPGLREILENEWFQRVWTAQELCLAVAPVIFYELRCLSWADFKLCAYYYLHDLAAATSTNSNPLMDSFLLRDFYYMRQLEEVRIDGPYAKNYDWFEILNSTKRRRASDPRDYLYALYSVCPDLVVRLRLPEIDYRIPAASLYEEATFCIIQSTGSLEALNWVVTLKRMAGLPSWVPDYSNFHEMVHEMDDDLESNSKNSSPMPIQIRLERHAGELRLLGRMLGKVEVISAYRTPFSYNTLRARNYFVLALMGWYRLRRDVQQSQDGGREGLDDSSFFRTLAYPRPPDEPATPSRIQPYTQFLPRLEEVLDGANGLWAAETGMLDFDRTDLIDLVYEANYAIEHRIKEQELRDLIAHLFGELRAKCLFSTSDGFWGLSVAAPEIGDAIVLFPGAATPMIVRSTPNGNDKFQLVGPALIPTISRATQDSVYQLESVESIALI